MKTIGLTGGIGSGKSLIAKIFFHLGVPVFNADVEAGKILDEDLIIRRQIQEWFGEECYRNGKPDRKRLAGIIFNNPGKLKMMNGLIHPAVLNRFVNWREEKQISPYVIHEAAILFESGFDKQMNSTILVTAPENIRIMRVVKRDKVTEAAVRERMVNQWSDEQKIPLAGFVILNDGETALLPKVLEIHHKLIE